MTHKNRAIQALEQMRGDDLFRARAAFANFTPEEMKLEHGRSGKTRQQILDSYEKHVSEVDAAIEWVRSCSE